MNGHLTLYNGSPCIVESLPKPSSSPGATVQGDDVPVADGDRLPRGRAHRPQEAAHAARAAPPCLCMLAIRRTTAIPHRSHIQVGFVTRKCILILCTVCSEGQGCQMVKCDPFLSLDCARVEDVVVQFNPEGPNTYNSKNWAIVIWQP